MNHLLQLLRLPKTTKATKKSDVKRAKMSAIAMTKRGKILAFANNRKLYGHKRKFTQHAEEALIAKLHNIKAFKRYNKIIILVVRINRDGVAMAKPCKTCQCMLRKYSVDVFYTSAIGTIIKLK